MESTSLSNSKITTLEELKEQKRENVVLDMLKNVRWINFLKWMSA